MYDKCYMLNLLSSLREMLLLEYQIMLLLLRKIIYSAHNKRNCDGVEHEIIMFFLLTVMVRCKNTGNVSKMKGSTNSV